MASSNTYSGAQLPGLVAWSPGYTAQPNTYAAFRSASPASAAPVIAPVSLTPTATGVEPAAYEANPLGKLRPKFIGGIALMGGRIIEGPWFGGTSTDPTLTAIYYLAEAANPGGTRTITELSIRGQVTGFDGSGNLTDPKFAGATVEFKTGASPQTPCLQSIERYGAKAIGYTRGILIAIKNLPLRPLAGIVPLISGKIEDSSFGDPSDGVSYTDLLSVILRDARYRDSEFSVDVSRTYPGMILASKSDLISFLQNERRIVVHMNVGFTDKIRITEPTTFQIDAEITNSNHVKGSLVLAKTDTTSAVRKIKSSYIDKDRDYQMNVVTATEDVFPYPSTSAVQEEMVERPVISTASQETSDAHIALYERLAVRSNMRATLLTSLFGTEVGDGARYADHDVINLATRVMETQHDYGTWQVQTASGEVLNCGADDPTDPYFDDVILLLNFNDTIDDASPLLRSMTALGDANVTDDGLVLDGTGDIVHTPTDYLTGLSATNTSPFTIEVLATFDVINVNQILLSVDSGAGGRFMSLEQDADDEILFKWSTTAGGTYDESISTTGANIVVDEPTFIVMDKDSTGKMRIYVRGVMYASYTPADSTVGAISPMTVGATILNVARWFTGTIRRVRVTRNASRYGDVHGDSSFTPSTDPFPEQGD